MIYLDTNIFVYPLVNPLEDAKRKACIKILKRVIKKEIVAATAVLTWDEFVYTIKKHLGREIAVEEGERLLRFSNLNTLRVDRSILEKAQELIAIYNINPRDAIHAATALMHGIRQIISDDSDFDCIKEIKRVKIS